MHNLRVDSHLDNHQTLDLAYLSEDELPPQLGFSALGRAKEEPMFNLVFFLRLSLGTELVLQRSREHTVKKGRICTLSK